MHPCEEKKDGCRDFLTLPRAYKIHLLLQVWNKIIADNEHKLGKLGESKFIHMTVNGGGL